MADKKAAKKTAPFKKYHRYHNLFAGSRQVVLEKFL